MESPIPQGTFKTVRKKSAKCRSDGCPWAEALGRTMKAVGRPLKLPSQRPLCPKRLWLTQPRSRWPKLARPQRPGFRITALS